MNFNRRDSHGNHGSKQLRKIIHMRMHERGGFQTGCHMASYWHMWEPHWLRTSFAVLDYKCSKFQPIFKTLIILLLTRTSIVQNEWIRFILLKNTCVGFLEGNVPVSYIAEHYADTTTC